MEEKELELIERFLAGQASPTERESVMQRMESDEEFAEHVELMREMPKAITADIKGFQEILQEVMTQKTEKKEVKINVIRRFPLLAVAASLLLLIGFVVMFLPSTSSPDTLFATFYEVPSLNISVRGQNQQVLINQGMEAYREGDYHKAVSFFDQYLVEDPNHNDLIFFKGAGQIAAGDYQAALETLETLTTQASLYSSASLWYQALAHLKLENIDRAHALLEQIIQGGNSSYRDRAQKLKRQLR